MFELFKVDESGNHRVQVFPTLEAAQAHLQALLEFWPGEYLISDQTTGESISIETGRETE